LLDEKSILNEMAWGGEAPPPKLKYKNKRTSDFVISSNKQYKKRVSAFSVLAFYISTHGTTL